MVTNITEEFEGTHKAFIGGSQSSGWEIIIKTKTPRTYTMSAGKIFTYYDFCEFTYMFNDAPLEYIHSRWLDEDKPEWLQLGIHENPEETDQFVW